MDDRPHLQGLFKALVYAESDAEYDEAKAALEEDEIVAKYPQYLRHLERRYFPRHEEWSISVRYRDQLPTHGCNTSNIVERSFRVEKDNVFNRTKAYNVVEVLDIKLDDHEHYRRRLINLGNGNIQQFKTSKYKAKKTSIKKSQIQDLGDGLFAVQSQSDSDIWYTTNLWSGYCECMGGRNSGPCVHKHAIAQHFQTSMFSVLPTMDANMRALCHVIATGTAQEDDWYRTPDDPDPNVNQFIQDYEDRCASAAADQPQETVNDNGNDEADEDNNEDDNEEEVLPDNEEDDNERGLYQEQLLQSLSEVFDTVQQQIFENIEDESVQKCTEYVVKHLKKASASGNISTLTRTLYQIGGLAAPRGEKRKNSGVITIQAASKKRRLHKHRGSGPATSGRKVKDLPSHSQAFSENIDDEDITFEHVRHSLPSQKIKRKQKHSLAADVQDNRSVSKK